MTSALIMTSIASPNEAMIIFARQCSNRDVDFILIGDKKSPTDFHLNGCRFVSIKEQRKLPFRLAKLLPENHYSRKNIGYLLAKEKDLIIETDDDNYPKENFWKKLLIEKKGTSRHRKDTGWVNIYSLFSEKMIWPRGFPLDHIAENAATKQFMMGRISNPTRLKRVLITNPDHQKARNAQGKMNIKILQGLADENPDVDAVFRMTFKLPFSFNEEKPVVLTEGQWCPFNSQNTVWNKDAFPLLYLPSYCSFRMTDIWRSFIAQRILWTCNWHLAFHSADVVQNRNEHDLLKDFQDEIPGYINNDKIKILLENLDLKSGKGNIAENMLRCYKRLVDEKIFVKQEMKLLEAWLYDMEV